MNAASVADLLTKQPSLQSPIAGYHVLAGAHPSSSLVAGQTLPTVDIMRTPGQPDKAVNITVTGPLQACCPPCTVLRCSYCHKVFVSCCQST